MGIDSVDITRFRRLLARRPQAAERIFTVAERSLLSGRVDAVPGLAARFAAKEATMKALGTGIGGVRFADVEVFGGGSQAPRLEDLRARGQPRRNARHPFLARVAHPHRLGRDRRRRGGLKETPHATGPYP